MFFPSFQGRNKNSSPSTTATMQIKNPLRGIGTFVQRLVYPKILKEIDEINRLSEIGLSCVEEEEKREEIRLPRIIVIGDESAGKSSTLERIAMADVFPRNLHICTRQPIVLTLRRDGAYEHDAPFVKVTLPALDSAENELVEEGISCERAREILQQRMDRLGELDNGMVIDKEIIVEVRSNGVPTIDLVDMPGIVATRADKQNPELSRLTEQCTSEYLAKETTGVVVCVVDAGIDNMRCSNALKLLQQGPEAIRNNAIGVFSKVDKAEDHAWDEEEDEEGRPRSGPLWKVEERMLGTHHDFKNSSEPYLGVMRGFIAVANRNTRNKRTKYMSLAEHNDFETDWMYQNFHQLEDDSSDVDPKILSCLGLDALVQKIDSVICEHLGKEWVPKKLTELTQKREELVLRLEKLGTNPKYLNLDQLWKTAEASLVSAGFLQKMVIVCEDQMEKMLPSPLVNDGSSIDHMTKQLEYRNAVINLLEAGSLFAIIRAQLKTEARSCLDFHDKTDTVNLPRFTSFINALEEALDDIMNLHREAFVSETCKVAESFFSATFEKDDYLRRDKLKFPLTQSMLETLVRPLVANHSTGQTFPFLRKDMLTEMPEENCAAERARYENHLAQLDEIEKRYNSIASSQKK